jgi:hypothetical protein
MTANSNAPKFSVLDKIAAVRQVMSVALRVVKAKPDVSLQRVARATMAAVLSKLEKLESKVEGLNDKQLDTMYALQAADEILPQLIDLIANADTTRALTDDEVTVLIRDLEEAKAKRKAAADKRKAEKEAEAKGKSEKAPKADAKQLAMV